ncbi:hypothetical protein GQ55_9G341000 [Panicum hallii var. hallii]|uniref:RNA helicase aquarius N-terminal domain-containing protein n=1 Tax=Panicum hallii var. hallii TaxID=1504633 RepID=A0A2T7C8E9_9POAL|nr:hypothetical protein GQ55_9G341000 [Panicum hallii var. hallii]
MIPPKTKNFPLHVPSCTCIRLSQISQKSRLLNTQSLSLSFCTPPFPSSIHPHRRSLPSPARRRPPFHGRCSGGNSSPRCFRSIDDILPPVVVGGRRCWRVEHEAQGTPFPLIAFEQECARRRGRRLGVGTWSQPPLRGRSQSCSPGWSSKRGAVWWSSPCRRRTRHDRGAQQGPRVHGRRLHHASRHPAGLTHPRRCRALGHACRRLGLQCGPHQGDLRHGAPDRGPRPEDRAAAPRHDPRGQPVPRELPVAALRPGGRLLVARHVHHPNEKFRENVAAWTCFHDRKDAFKGLLWRVLKLNEEVHVSRRNKQVPSSAAAPHVTGIITVVVHCSP